MQQVYHSIEPAGERSVSHCRKVVFTIVALGIIILSIYSNSFDCSWHFDDEPNITDNPNLHLRELSWKNIKLALFSDRNHPNTPYRPAACLSFALNHYFGGLDVFGYHVVNILIHLLASIFLFLFIHRTLELPSLKGRYSHNAYFIALFATVLWAINPVQTQAITYLVQRMASLAGMFYIMSMYVYLKARVDAKGVPKVLLFILCFVFFLMALGSKENAVMLPLSIFLYEILLLQGLTRENLRRNLRFFLVVTIAILILGLTYVYFLRGNIFSFLDGYGNRPFTLAQRLLTEPRVLIFYISLLLYPVTHRLNIAHSIEVSTSLLNPITTLASIFLIIGIIVYAASMARKRPLLTFCALFFFLNHVIESTVFPLELIFEHRNYIPSMLFFLPIALGLSYLLELYTKKGFMKNIIAGFIILLLIGLGHSTFMRNFTWKNEESLWIDAVEKAPDLSRPHHNLGRYYQNHGFNEKAIFEYQKALKNTMNNRKDETYVTYYNLGQIYAESNDFEKALQFFNRAVNIFPHFPAAYNDIAALLNRKGKHEIGYKYLVKAFEINPNSPEVNFNLGLHYLRELQPDKAISHLSKLSDDRQFEDRLFLYLGIAFKQKGHLGRALTSFKKGKKKNPRNIKLYLHLAEIFYRIGDHEKAEREAAKAIDLIPDKDTFQMILDDLQKKDRSSNLHPRTSIIIPLMSKACLTKSETLKKWGDLLEEAALQLKAENGSKQYK
jgi:tetratricopeptide (TPR) repeat protein